MTNIFCQPSHVARTALMALILAMSSGTARASEVNMWFDETGQVHYSDIPPVDAEAPRVPQSRTFRADTRARNMSHGGPGIIATAPDSASDAAPVRTEDQRNKTAAQALAERRQKMIQDCEQNNGIDCEREVDTELGAESIERGGHVIHQVRSDGPTR
jgi:hypothetical protein